MIARGARTFARPRSGGAMRTTIRTTRHSYATGEAGRRANDAAVARMTQPVERPMLANSKSGTTAAPPSRASLYGEADASQQLDEAKVRGSDGAPKAHERGGRRQAQVQLAGDDGRDGRGWEAAGGRRWRRTTRWRSSSGWGRCVIGFGVSSPHRRRAVPARALVVGAGGGRAAVAWRRRARRRGGASCCAARGRSPCARLGHQLPVDDRVRLAAAFEARAADRMRRVDGVCGGLLGVEVADASRCLPFSVGVFMPEANAAGRSCSHDTPQYLDVHGTRWRGARAGSVDDGRARAGSRRNARTSRGPRLSRWPSAGVADRLVHRARGLLVVVRPTERFFWRSRLDSTRATACPRAQVTPQNRDNAGAPRRAFIVGSAHLAGRIIRRRRVARLVLSSSASGLATTT